MQQESPDLTKLRGLIATVNLTGSIEYATSEALLHMALWNVEHGFTNVEYRTFAAQLVEAGRDEVLMHTLNEDYDFVLMFDGDSIFPADALARMLQAGFVQRPDADVVGAYAQLKVSYAPTIDTGTGTWEPWFPGEGIIDVMRTGGHFLLIKPPILHRFGPPWFRTRKASRAIAALADVDNYARIKLDGRNPFAKTEEWQELLQQARKDADSDPGTVGEDSGFCDAAKAVGATIVVNTDLVAGHIERKVIQPNDLLEKMNANERRLDAAVGITD